MYTICLLGAGKIGEAIAALLSSSGRYRVRVCDSDFERTQHIAAAWPALEAHKLDLKDGAACAKLMQGCNAVISALPYHCNKQIAELALQNKLHYFDLTEDVETTKLVSQLARGASTCFMPQCGLAPGFISIVTSHLVRSFDTLESVKMRVGALPLYPSNALKYNLTWSTEGLINEYGNMCEVIDGGKKRLALPLEGYERFTLDGDEYEAFNTSGGLGSLCESYEGKVNKLDYKTVRYPGHRDLMAFLMNDLRMNSDREALKHIFERSIPTTAQDKCVVFVEVQGYSKDRFIQRTYASKIYNLVLNNHHFGAIQLTTASGVCAPVDMILSGKLKFKGGRVRCEDVPFLDFLDNEFGKVYRDERALSGIAH